MKRTNSIILATALLMALGVSGCRGEPHANADTTVVTQNFPQLSHLGGQEVLSLKPSDVPGMTYAEVQQVSLPGVLETTGQVNFVDDRVSTISSRVQGRIENMRVATWDNVHRGELVLQLYSPDFMMGEAEYLQAKTTSGISAHSSIPGSADLAQSMVLAARHKLELLGMSDADIDGIKGAEPTIWMRAPVSGTVVQNKATIGSAINPGDVLYQLGTLDRVWLNADIYEVALAGVKCDRHLRGGPRSRESRTATRGSYHRVSR